MSISFGQMVTIWLDQTFYSV